MSQRPATFGQLLRRIATPRTAEAQYEGHFIASISEVAGASGNKKSPSWVILHSITDSGLQLIHPRPLPADELAVQIPVVSGEIVRVTLVMAGTQRNGELYESTAQFL